MIQKENIILRPVCSRVFESLHSGRHLVQIRKRSAHIHPAVVVPKIDSLVIRSASSPVAGENPALCPDQWYTRNSALSTYTFLLPLLDKPVLLSHNLCILSLFLNLDFSILVPPFMFHFLSLFYQPIKKPQLPVVTLRLHDTTISELTSRFVSIRLIPQSVDDILLSDFSCGIYHGNENYQEHTEYTGSHTAPWEHKFHLYAPGIHTHINQKG